MRTLAIQDVAIAAAIQTNTLRSPRGITHASIATTRRLKTTTA